MTAVQSTYSATLAPGRAGLVVGSDYNSDTGSVETAAGIGFGLAVSQGAADKGAILGGSLAGFRGISIRDVTLAVTQLDKYVQYDNMGILVRGKIWVAPAVAVVAGQAVNFDATTGVLSNTGGAGPVKGARWVTSAAGTGDLALVELSGFQRGS